MDLDRVWKGVLAIAVLAIAFVVLVEVGLAPAPWTADEGEVQVADDAADEPKAVIEVEVADTYEERYTGLSDHDSLEPGTGMLFVHGSEGERTYVMRDMNFDIDIVFIGADREITAIEHARAPEADEDGEDLQYTGRAKWVLEVPRGYTNETGIEVGDEVAIDVDAAEVSIGASTSWSADATIQAAPTIQAVPTPGEPMAEPRSIAEPECFGSK